MRKRRIALLLAAATLTSVAAAIPASASASGSGFVANQYPADVHMNGVEGPTKIALGAWASLDCDTTQLWAGMRGATNGPFETQSGGGAYCYQSSFEPVALEENGCEVTLHPGAETSANVFTGSFDIGGPNCTAITLKRSGSGSAYCHISIPAQSGLAAGFENTGSGSLASVMVSQKASGLKYTAEGNAAGCPPKGSYENGTWSSTREATALNEAGSRIGLSLDPTPATGVYLEGGQFKGESYPLVLEGGQVTQHAFRPDTESWQLKCGTVHSESLLAGSTSALPVGTSYGSCLAAESKATVAMNSCHYVFNGGGTMDIACDKAGDVIAINTYKADGVTVKCTLELGAQTGLKGLTHTNFGKGSDQGVEVGFKVEGISFNVVQGLLGCLMSKGLHTSGTYTGTTKLLGGFQ